MAVPTHEGSRRIGEVIAGKYEIVRSLGEGGMGVVYEAKHTFVGRRVAIKFLRAEYTGETDMLARFQREAQAAGALESENVAAVHDFGVAPDGTPYLVLEHLAGEDLASLLARTGRLPVARAIGIVLQACRGLVAAHARGIVHRDLKPENLFVLRREDGTDMVKIIDFGIAKLRSGAADASSQTRTGAPMGTPYYMPPEQARGQRDVDHRADIYALGVILYEILAGRKPHPGQSYNEILFHILTQTPVPLSSLREGLPPSLLQAIERAMAFEPHDRFSQAVDLARALAPFGSRAVAPDVAEQPDRLGSVRAPAASTLATPVTGAPTPPGRPPPRGLAPASGGGPDDRSARRDPADEPPPSLISRATRRRPGAVGLAIGAAILVVVAIAAIRVGGRRRGGAEPLAPRAEPAPPLNSPALTTGSAPPETGAPSRDEPHPRADEPDPALTTPKPTSSSRPPELLPAPPSSAPTRATRAHKRPPVATAAKRGSVPPSSTGGRPPAADIDDRNPYNQ